MSYLACEETITIVQMIQGEDEDRYICTQVENASWFSKVVIALEDKGVRADDVVRIRIPEEELPETVKLKNGDHIIRGTVDGTITKRSDLKGYEFVTVVSVGDNRRGSLRHWAVIGKR